MSMKNNNNRKDSMKNKTSKPNADRMIMDLAYFTEANPSDDPKVNEFWKGMRKSYEDKGHILKFGKCEICGEEGVLCEIGLNWTCNWNDKCKKEMDDWYKEEIKVWQKEQQNECRKD